MDAVLTNKLRYGWTHHRYPPPHCETAGPINTKSDMKPSPLPPLAAADQSWLGHGEIPGSSAVETQNKKKSGGACGVGCVGRCCGWAGRLSWCEAGGSAVEFRVSVMKCRRLCHLLCRSLSARQSLLYPAPPQQTRHSPGRRWQCSDRSSACLASLTNNGNSASSAAENSGQARQLFLLNHCG